MCVLQMVQERMVKMQMIQPQVRMFLMAGQSGSRETVLEQRSKGALSDEDGLRELNPFKSPK